MVTEFGMVTMSSVVVLGAAKAVEPVLERLDPPRRAAVVMALLALTLIGLFLIVFAMVGGHWVRRLARDRPGSGRKRRIDSAGDNARLRESLQPIVPEAKSDDTIQLGTSSKDTKVEG
jgi:hypothetical protein